LRCSAWPAVTRSSDRTRDDLIGVLYDQYRIKCVVHYWPLNRTELFRKFGFDEAKVPNTDRFFENIIGLRIRMFEKTTQLTSFTRVAHIVFTATLGLMVTAPADAAAPSPQRDFVKINNPKTPPPPRGIVSHQHASAVNAERIPPMVTQHAPRDERPV